MSTIDKWASLNSSWQGKSDKLKTSSQMRDGNPYSGALVLVVDDDPTERLIARDALERAGYRVIEAEDGPGAVAKAHKEKPDFMILDIMMPVFDGFTVCDTLRNTLKQTELPILIATGLGDEDAIQRGFDLGANDFMVKPINWETLALRIKYIMRSVGVTLSQREQTTNPVV